MFEAQCFDPSLLTERECDEEPQLDQLGNAEVLVEFRPQGVVRNLRIPDDRARVGQRDLLAFGELR